MVAESNNIGTGSYSVWQAMEFVMLNWPANFNLILPIASLLGCIFALGGLANHGELLIIRASGVSIRRIMLHVTYAAIPIVLLGAFLGSYLAPTLRHTAYIKRMLDKHKEALLFTKKSIWLKNSNNFVLIHQNVSPKELNHLQVFVIKNNRLEALYKIKSAHYINKQWYLEDIDMLSIGDKKIVKHTYKSMIWKHLVTPQLLKVIAEDPGNLTLFALYRYIRYGVQNKLNTAGYSIDFWQKIFSPISILISMLLAVPFVFGSLRSTSFSKRLLIGIFLGGTLFIMQQFCKPFAVIYNIPPILGAMLPCLIFSTILLLLLLWQNKTEN